MTQRFKVTGSASAFISPASPAVLLRLRPKHFPVSHECLYFDKARFATLFFLFVLFGSLPGATQLATHNFCHWNAVKRIADPF